MAKSKFGKKVSIAILALALSLSILLGGAIANSHQAATSNHATQIADGGGYPPPVYG